MLFYRAALPLSRKTLAFVAGIIRRHWAAIGSLWRKPGTARQPLLVLAYLRKGETFADLAAGFGPGMATARRYERDCGAAGGPRSQAPQGAWTAKKAGCAYVVLDGTLIPIDRVAADRRFYSGKDKKHGMNLQVIAPRRRPPVGVQGAARSVHDTRNSTPWEKEQTPSSRRKILSKLRCCPWRAGKLGKAIHAPQTR